MSKNAHFQFCDSQAHFLEFEHHRFVSSMRFLERESPKGSAEIEGMISLRLILKHYHGNSSYVCLHTIIGG